MAKGGDASVKCSHQRYEERIEDIPVLEMGFLVFPQASRAFEHTQPMAC